MGLLDLFSKKPTKPYRDESLNHLYELLFCDNLRLYQKPTPPTEYPWPVLLAEAPAPAVLLAIATDDALESRPRLLACRRLTALGEPTGPLTLLGVVVEVALLEGLDVLAAFVDGRARYFNQAGKLLVWETSTAESEQLIALLLAAGRQTVSQIGPWDKQRLPPPAKGLVRMTFLVSDGLYFGQGPFEVLQQDPLGAPVIGAATQLMIYLTEQGLKQSTAQ
ncbi:MAG: hypothetical protein ACRYFK_13280 [Janthinobacterium lividum]